MVAGIGAAGRAGGGVTARSGRLLGVSDAGTRGAGGYGRPLNSYGIGCDCVVPLLPSPVAGEGSGMGGHHACYCRRPQRRGNQRQCGCRIFRGDATGDADNLEMLTREPGVALDVGVLATSMIVDRTIDLDDEPALQTDEINNERSDPMLPAKPQPPLLPAAQNVPERIFGLGCARAQRPGAGDAHRLPPRPNRASVVAAV